MTPRERDTLEAILRHVASHNQRPIVAVNHHPVAWLVDGQLIAADIAIDGVVFAPQHRESA